MGRRSRTTLFTAALLLAAAARADAGATATRADAAEYGAADAAPFADAAPARDDGAAAAQPAPCQPEDSHAAGSAGDAGRSAPMAATPEQENPDLQRIWSGP